VDFDVEPELLDLLPVFVVAGAGVTCGAVAAGAAGAWAAGEVASVESDFLEWVFFFVEVLASAELVPGAGVD